MAETLKVGLIGAGGIAVQHGIGWLANAPRGEIVAVADVSPVRARSFASAYSGGAAVYESIGEIIADPAVRAVDICLPHHLHTEAILAAAAAGKAILCEKPLCIALEDAARIDAALRDSGVTFVMAHNQLFQPSLIEARRLLATGILGKPYIARSIEAFQNQGASASQAAADIATGESRWAWRSDPARMGGGEVLDTGWHASYRLLALADSRPVNVMAMMDRFLLADLPSEDTGLLMIRFESGLVGEILTSWAFSTVNDWQFEVMAEYGSIAGNRTRTAHQLHAWDSPAELRNEPAHTFTAEITHFLDVVQLGVPNLAPIETGARVLQLTKAAYQSAAAGRPVALPENPYELES
ncbi:MAG: Gfo/Idh/MocA family oxidoreductase [Chloroflexota bacterium]|nr:Gfo/Idh/MocA family oxidoreductase [Chloroflexota bacterium]